MRETDANIATFSEHKIRSKDVKKTKAEFRDCGWSMLCGPADEEGTNAAAGVGAAWKEDVKLFQEEIKDPELAKARELGRVGKVHDGLWLG